MEGRGERHPQEPWAEPEPGSPGRARRALCRAHSGEWIRAAPQSLRLCGIPCLRQATGGLPEPSPQRVRLLRPDSSRPSTATWGWLMSWPRRAERWWRRGPGLKCLTVGWSKGLGSRGSGLHPTFSSSLLALMGTATGAPAARVLGWFWPRLGLYHQDL